MQINLGSCKCPYTADFGQSLDSLLFPLSCLPCAWCPWGGVSPVQFSGSVSACVLGVSSSFRSTGAFASASDARGPAFSGPGLWEPLFSLLPSSVREVVSSPHSQMRKPRFRISRVRSQHWIHPPLKPRFFLLFASLKLLWCPEAGGLWRSGPPSEPCQVEAGAQPSSGSSTGAPPGSSLPNSG